MQIVPNQALTDAVLKELRTKYIDKSVRKDIHLTHCIYCLTRSYYDLTDPDPPTREELMLFSIGFGLEKVLLDNESIHGQISCDGILLTPDFVTAGGNVAELKTTRMSSAKPDLPDSWIEQMLGYCKALGITQYRLAILYLMGNWKPPFPDIKAFTIDFTQEEIDTNWNKVLHRRDILVKAIQAKKPPEAKLYCKDWECKSCRYRLRCGLV